MTEAVPLSEYPRPQLRRDGHTVLNGWWDCAFTPAGVAPDEWDQRILVPFSPETVRSGVGRQLQPHEALWYRRRFTHTAHDGHRTILHFGAVDQSCRVLVDGVEVAAHVGGYLPFAIDVTQVLREGTAHEIVVEVRDLSETSHHATGKQRLRRGGIWYTAQSGIWQTVWMEQVPQVHVVGLRLRTPDVRTGMSTAIVEVSVESSDGSAAPSSVTVRAGSRIIAAVDATSGSTVRIPIDQPRLWTPEDPFLYDIDVVLGSDRVASYVGVRSVDVAPDPKGMPRLRLNGDPYPHIGVLDQGYWEDSLYTAPDDDALVRDIVSMKELGFTMLRKHIKVESLRWYHHCDRLGMLVWQDAVNGGAAYRPWVITTPVVSPRIRLTDRWHRIFGRADGAGRRQFLHELDEMVALLRNSPSVVTWVPFNEGWGQFDAARVVERLRRGDPDRVIDHASGWHDQRAGDLRSLHVYFQPIRPARWWGRDGRALVVSEFGGYSLRLPGHRYPQREFGYRRTRSREEFTRAYEELHRREVLPAIEQGLSATVYTQLADVEDESNGLLTADRTALKPDGDTVRALNAEFRATFAAATREPVRRS
ncbi:MULTISPECIES: glycoside hydrolase family 2 protein [unclassified Microbacterium]|uniref:glycoside hydrolase family 2 protein n=1 Tax=unclassified Microbacterium TaxID=2609290 RepID=UPI001604F444|nr:MULTISPECIES: sugar-binding domain-containing protein [unclassified Microbacterium]QNA93905.1 glycoside hydrolase family 2 [Microbacterium sp. Se63.02b]QYM64212.1 glycoside hydrolase family 2 [Microbacterium sp. Se5.02b]